jgi:hypothetical protein
MTTSTFWYIAYQLASQNAAGFMATDDKIAKKRRASRRKFRSLPSVRLLKDRDFSGGAGARPQWPKIFLENC